MKRFVIVIIIILLIGVSITVVTELLLPNNSIINAIGPALIGGCITTLIFDVKKKKDRMT